MVTTTQTDSLFVKATATTLEGMSAIFTKLQAQKDASVDGVFRAKRDIRATVEEGEVKLVIPQRDGILAGTSIGHTIRPSAHDQLGEITGIPGKYYDRMLTEAPSLLADSINTWLAKSDRSHLVRVTGGAVRAVLSDRYLMIPNERALFTAFTEMKAKRDEGLRIWNLSITEKNFYVAMVHDGWAEQFDFGGVGGAHTFLRTKDHTAAPYVVIKNSETGHGGLSVSWGMFFSWCTNTAIGGKQFERVHLGDRMEYGFATPRLYAAKIEEIGAQMEASLLAAFDRTRFQAQVAKLSGLYHETVEEPVAVVDNLTERLGLTEAEKQQLLSEWLSPTASGAVGSTLGDLFQSLTFIGTKTEDPARAFEFAEMGGRFIDEAHELVALPVARKKQPLKAMELPR